MEPLVHVAGITKTFAGRQAVHDLSFDVFPGEIFSLLGPNGAGKTTTVRMLIGVIQPDEGRITVSLDGVTQTTLPPTRTSYLPEDRGLYREIPVLRTLVYFGQLRGLDKHEATKRALDWLARVNLLDRKDERVDSLSKGNQQRVQLIASIIHRPRLAILDEPLNGADPRQRVHFQHLLRQLATQGRTIILSSHILEEVEQLAETVLLIVNGKLAASGGFRAIRAALNQRPYHVRVLCDAPRRLAAEIVELDSVDAVHVDPDGALVVLSRNVLDLQIELPRRAQAASIRLRRVEPLDDSLESVFGYLVEG